MTELRLTEHARRLVLTPGLVPDAEFKRLLCRLEPRAKQRPVFEPISCVQS